VWITDPLLVGTDPERILKAARRALEYGLEGLSVGQPGETPPFGSGRASDRIVGTIEMPFLKEMR
jgi:UDP-N-acetylglucosamine 2-epimerase